MCPRDRHARGCCHEMRSTLDVVGMCGHVRWQNSKVVGGLQFFASWAAHSKAVAKGLGLMCHVVSRRAETEPVLIALAQSHAELVRGVVDLAARVQSDPTLVSLIRRKFAIKCTTGYSLNALVDFPLSDPIEIIKRLMIGSEGTLGFVSQATYNTVPEWPHKARCFPRSLIPTRACTAAPSVLLPSTRAPCWHPSACCQACLSFGCFYF